MTFLRLLSFFIVFSSLFSCSINNASIKAKDLPSTVSYSIIALEDVNPNLEGKASPLALQVFELKDNSKLFAADYDSLKNDHEVALGSNYIDHNDFTLLPEEFKFIETKDLNKDTRYIGVIANYGDLDVTQWKKVIKVKAVGREYHLLILLKAQEIILDKVE